MKRNKVSVQEIFVNGARKRMGVELQSKINDIIEKTARENDIYMTVVSILGPVNQRRGDVMFLVIFQYSVHIA